MKALYFLIIVLNFLVVQVNAQLVHQSSGTEKRLLTLHFLNENEGWAGGNDGTILKTVNGGNTWTSQNIGTLVNIHSIFFIDSLIGWAVLYEWTPNRHGSIIHSTDGGESWNVQFSIQGYTFHSIHFNDENNGWVVGSSGIAFLTTNGGYTWLQQYPNTQGGWLWPVFFIDNNIGWTAGDPLFGMFKSTDGGNSWSSTSLPVVERVYSLIFLDHQIGWLSAAQGQIAKSIDGGISWEIVQSGTSQYLRDIYFLDYNIGWSVGYNGTIIYSTDGGNYWNDQFSGTSSDLYSVQFIDDQIGWIVGDNGIILKTNNGGIPVELVSFSAQQNENEIQLSWITATETNNFGFEVERRNSDEWEQIGFVEGVGTTTEIQYYSFTDNNSELKLSDKISYRLKQLDLDGTYEYSKEVEVIIEQTTEYFLSQNYPNPFNPGTTISFTLKGKTDVNLKVYDLIGNLIAVIVDERLNFGKHEITFDGTGLTSGVYYYKLEAGRYKDVKKMLLIK